MTKPEPPVTEPSPAPEILVDGYVSVADVGGVARFTFFSLGHNPVTGSLERRVVARIAMPYPTVQGVWHAMGEWMRSKEEAALEASENPNAES